MRVMGGASSELLGPQQGVGEVDQERGGHYASKDVFDKHGGTPLETVAAERVGDGQGEEAEASGQQDQVQHGLLLAMCASRSAS